MKFVQWALLSMVLGNPLLALIVIVIVYWTLDRYTLGVLPDPFRVFARWRRLSASERRLRDNPNDRKARLDKADVLLELGRPKAAFDAVKPNVEAGDHDAHTLFIAGRAAFGAGEPVIGNRLLEAVREDDPKFGQGRVDLELGRGRLEASDFEGAKTALLRFIAARSTAIEGNVLLARALAGLEDLEGAAQARRAAWQAYTEAPAFLRRRERLWAWRANPGRPITYAAIGLAAGISVAVFVLPNLR